MDAPNVYKCAQHKATVALGMLIMVAERITNDVKNRHADVDHMFVHKDVVEALRSEILIARAALLGVTEAVVPETLDIFTPSGRAAIFTCDGGYDVEKESAKLVLEIGEAYVIDLIEVGGWNNSVSLVGIDGWFNTCMFKNAPGYVPATEC